MGHQQGEELCKEFFSIRAWRKSGVWNFGEVTSHVADIEQNKQDKSQELAGKQTRHLLIEDKPPSCYSGTGADTESLTGYTHHNRAGRKGKGKNDIIIF